MTADRHDRQRRLREIGEPGQARIEAHEARIAAGPGAPVALAYLVRSGVPRARIERGVASPFPHARHFRFSAPLAVGRGAHAALARLRLALNGQMGGQP